MVALLERLRKEWHVIKATPFSFAIVCLIAISACFGGIRWYYTDKIKDANARTDQWKGDVDYWKDRAGQKPECPLIAPSENSKPVSQKPKQQAAKPIPKQDNSVHVDNGSSIKQNSNGDCSPNMVGGANTFNCGPPPPKMTWEHYQWPIDRPKPNGIVHPDAYARISIDRDWPHAKFVVFCDRPCQAVTTCSGVGLGVIGTRFVKVPGYPNALAFLVYGPDPLPVEPDCIVGVQSEDDNAVRIENIQQIKPPDKN
jgi:hypothetical protein